MTIGAIAASQATALAASPSSHAPMFPPPSDAAARCAAHAARIAVTHSLTRVVLPSISRSSASGMCTQTFTGCPARSGGMPAAASRRMR